MKLVGPGLRGWGTEPDPVRVAEYRGVGSGFGEPWSPPQTVGEQTWVLMGERAQPVGMEPLPFSGDRSRTPKVAGAVREVIYSTPAPDFWGDINPCPTPRLSDNYEDNGKWEEIPYLDLFYYLGRRTDWQKECGIMVLTVAYEKCRGCENRDQKADYLVKYKDPEEDVSLLVSPSAPPPETASEEEGEEGVKKPNGKYRLVQDLRAINEITKDIHPVVANPYTLLTSVSEKFEWFTVIDLKDAFFCIPLALESRKYFAFEWENPDTGRKRQLTWSRLPQGFKNSPTIFGNQLARELEEWKTTQVTVPSMFYVVLQYVDDIFLAATERDICSQLTISLLNMLGQGGYRVSRDKAQLVRTEVVYLGCEISKGVRKLGTNRIAAICAIPIPRNHQELRSFLGMVGWCRLWILNFGLLARPLYEALKEVHWTWGHAQEKAFLELKQALRKPLRWDCQI
ncbi:hypothetical protein DUI87_03521 [Hirundo rustica rustica]|uniref:ribonuclease H n=1 Tax=Hirundo rustica rustica TaxID=333673 RepID=A0A3M0L0J6_HIRRU|nr:hypothetical protein DUI87_03521 [Hirundo rustica rustica]